MQLSKEELKKVFGLSWKTALQILGISLVILIIVNYSLIINQFTKGSILSQSDVQDSFANQLSTWFSSPILNLLVLVIFWVGVGIIAYSVIYSIYSLANEARNEVEVESEYVNTGNVKKRLRVPIIQLGIIAAMLVLAVISLRFLFPIWNNWFTNAVLAFPSNIIQIILYFLLSLLGLSFNIYLFKTLITFILVLE